MAACRPGGGGIWRGRGLHAPRGRWAKRLSDTGDLAPNERRQQSRETFARDGLDEPTLSVMSFGYARGVPRNADLVFDMRFLRNPHWVDALRPGTGLDADVSAYIADDPAYADAMTRIESLLLLLLPQIGRAQV